MIALGSGAHPTRVTAAETRPVVVIETGRHTAGTLEAAMDAKGRVLVTASMDRTARVWSLPTLRPLMVLRPPVVTGSGVPLAAVAVSPDGRFAAIEGQGATSEEHRILVFELTTGEIVHAIAGLSQSILSLAYSRDGTSLAAGFNGGLGVRVWNTSTWAERFADTAYREGLYALAFGPDGRLAAAALDGTLRLYDAGGQIQGRQQLRAGRLPVRAAFSPDGTALAVVFEDATEFEVRDGRTLVETAHPDVTGLEPATMSRAAFGRDGTLFASGSPIVDGRRPVFAWDGRGTGRRQLAYPGFPTGEGVFAVLPLPDGGMVLMSEMGSLASYDRTGRLIAQQATVAQQLNSTVEISDSTRRLLVSADGTQVAWMAFGDRRRWLTFDARRPQLAMQSSAPVGMGDWTSQAGSLVVTDWRRGTSPKLNDRPLPLLQNEIVHGVSVMPGTVVLGTAWFLRQFDGDGQERWRQTTPDEVWRVNQSGDGRLVVAAIGDGTIRWFRSADGVEVLSLFVSADARQWVAWTPSGYFAANPAGEDLIGLQLDRGPDQAADFFLASQFREVFQRYGVVQRALTTASEADALRDADAARGQASRPVVSIASDLPPVLTAVLQHQASGAGGRQAALAYAVRSPSDRPVRAIHVCVRRLPMPDCTARDDVVPDGSGAGVMTVAVPAGASVEVQLRAETATRSSLPTVVQVGD